jgi:hypothetical protein
METSRTSALLLDVLKCDQRVCFYFDIFSDMIGNCRSRIRAVDCVMLISYRARLYVVEHQLHGLSLDVYHLFLKSILPCMHVIDFITSYLRSIIYPPG